MSLLDVAPLLTQVDREEGGVLFEGEPWTGIRRILVVRNEGLEELVHTLPALRALQDGYPDAWIALLVRRDLAGFASILDDVDQVIVDPGDTLGLVERMGEFRADLAICISRDARSSWAAYKAGIPRRVGTGFRLYSPLFHRRVDEHRHPGTRHEIDRALAFAQRSGAGSGSGAVFPVSLPPHVLESVDHWLELHRVRKPYVVLRPGSDGNCPVWPAAHYIGLATLLEAEQIPVVFALESGDEPFSEALDREHPTIRSRPRFQGDILSLAALMVGSATVVGSCCGAIHVASALGTPTLALHPPWPSCGVGRRGPISDRGWAIVADLEEARHWSRRARGRMGDRLMAGIPPASVLRCVRAILQDRSPTLAESPDKAGEAVGA